MDFQIFFFLSNIPFGLFHIFFALKVRETPGTKSQISDYLKNKKVWKSIKSLKWAPMHECVQIIYIQNTHFVITVIFCLVEKVTKSCYKKVIAYFLTCSIDKKINCLSGVTVQLYYFIVKFNLTTCMLIDNPTDPSPKPLQTPVITSHKKLMKWPFLLWALKKRKLILRYAYLFLSL